MFCCCLTYILAAVVLILITISSSSRYYLKMLIFSICTILLATLLPIPQFIARPRDHRNALLPAFGCRWLLRALGVSFELRGIENIQHKFGGVVLINHQSLIDLAILAYLWPVIGRATVVAKKAVLYVFPFGPAAYLWGTLYIDRADRTNATSKLNQESHAIRENAAKLLLFPEGTRHDGEKLLPFKKGAFHLAVQSQSAIQPVVVSRYYFLDGKRKIFGRGHSIIHILPEISCKGMTKDQVPALLERTQQIMQDEYDKLNAEISSKHIKRVL